MQKNSYYFKVEGLWENKMQKILYDYMMNSGPIEVKDGKIKDLHNGHHRRLVYPSKSTLFDILGYADRDVEKWYASWKNVNGVAKIGTSLQSVDIYDGLYDDFVRIADNGYMAIGKSTIYHQAKDSDFAAKLRVIIENN